jgi:hypothetical protein
MDVPYEPHPGDGFLVPMPGWGGTGIKVAQWLAADGWTKYQHAGTFVGDVDSWDGMRTVEAYPGGAIVGRIDRYDPDSIVWLRCPPAYRDAVAAAALAYVDVPYSFADYGALSLHRFHIPAPHLQEFIARRKSMICSQLVDAAAADGGWHIFDDDRWPGFVTPNDLGKAARLQLPGGYVERVKVSR